MKESPPVAFAPCRHRAWVPTGPGELEEADARPGPPVHRAYQRGFPPLLLHEGAGPPGRFPIDAQQGDPLLGKRPRTPTSCPSFGARAAARIGGGDEMPAIKRGSRRAAVTGDLSAKSRTTPSLCSGVFVPSISFREKLVVFVEPDDFPAGGPCVESMSRSSGRCHSAAGFPAATKPPTIGSESCSMNTVPPISEALPWRAMPFSATHSTHRGRGRLAVVWPREMAAAPPQGSLGRRAVTSWPRRKKSLQICRAGRAIEMSHARPGLAEGISRCPRDPRQCHGP